MDWCRSGNRPHLTVGTKQPRLTLEALQRLYPTRLRVLRILSHEPADSNWSGLRGLVTAALDDALGVDYRAVSAFVCGSLPMVEAVERVLLRQGVPASRIHADKFLPSR